MIQINNWKSFCFLFLFYSLLGISQGTFSISIAVAPDYGSDTGWEIGKLRNDYILASGSFCSKTGSECIGLVRVNSNGEVIWRKIVDPIDEKLSLGGSNAMVISREKIVLSLDFLSKPGDRDLRLMGLDENGDTIWTNNFYANHDVENVGLTHTSDYGFLLYSQKNTQPQNSYLEINLIKTDSLGNLIWEESYKKGNWWWVVPFSAVPRNSNEYIVTSLVDTAGGGLFTQASINLVNSDGKFGREKMFEGIEFETPKSMTFPSHDGGFVFFWAEDQSDTITKSPYPPMVIGLNGDFKESWRFVFEDTANIDRYLSNVIPLSNGDFLGLGYGLTYDVVNRFLTYGWVFRIKPNGKVKWTRFIRDIRPNYTDFSFWNAIEDNEGNLVISGTIDTVILDSLNNEFIDANVWLLKLDSSGCFAPNCGEYQFLFDTTIASNTEFERTNIEERRKVFPNPFSKKLHIQQKASTIRSITISNNIGRVVFTKSMEAFEELLTIDLSDVSPGLYFLGVYDSKGRLIWNEKICKIE